MFQLWCVLMHLLTLLRTFQVLQFLCWRGGFLILSGIQGTRDIVFPLYPGRTGIVGIWVAIVLCCHLELSGIFKRRLRRSLQYMRCPWQLDSIENRLSCLCRWSSRDEMVNYILKQLNVCFVHTFLLMKCFGIKDKSAVRLVLHLLPS